MRFKRKKFISPLFKYIFSSCLRFVLSSVQKFFRLCLNHLKITTLTLIILGFLTFSYMKMTSLIDYNDRILPKTVVVSTGRASLDEEIKQTIILKLIKDAKKSKLPKRFLFNEVDSALKRYKLISEYSIRMGLDRILYVHAKPHEGLIVIKNKDKKSFLVDKKLNVIEENIPSYMYASLARLTIPDFGSKDKSRSLTNFPWMSRMSETVKKTFYTKTSPYKLEEVSWNDTQGFALLLSLKDKNQMKAILGEEKIEKKAKRLKHIMDDLSRKNLSPELIDITVYKTPLIKIRMADKS
jgi:hypothetical protein